MAAFLFGPTKTAGETVGSWGPDLADRPSGPPLYYFLAISHSPFSIGRKA